MSRVGTILRKAARRVERGEEMYGCHAINDAEGVEHYTKSPAVKFYEGLYEGGEDGSGQYCGSWFGENAEVYMYGPRIVALCLAAAIADDKPAICR